ncbi:MAG: 4Fe-4S dicluster domain-containing protein [Candidatus Hermodarchaeota archaeon]
MKAASPDLRRKIEELQSLMYLAATELEKCKSCGTCVQFCPLKIRKFNDEGKAITIKTDKSCGGCSVCYKRCPQGAIKLIQMKKIIL